MISWLIYSSWFAGGIAAYATTYRQVYMCIIIRQFHSFVDRRAACVSAHPYLMLLTKTTLIWDFTFKNPRSSSRVFSLFPLPLLNQIRDTKQNSSYSNRDRTASIHPAESLWSDLMLKLNQSSVTVCEDGGDSHCHQRGLIQLQH